MSWIWSDELAAAAEAEGIDGPRVATWRRQLVAIPRESGRGANDLVRDLLGIEATSQAAQDAPAPSSSGVDVAGPGCTCGDSGATTEILGSEPAPR